MVEENERFDRITKLHEELIVKLDSEKAACIEASSFLSSSDIAGYIGGRME